MWVNATEARNRAQDAVDCTSTIEDAVKLLQEYMIIVCFIAITTKD